MRKLVFAGLALHWPSIAWCTRYALGRSGPYACTSRYACTCGTSNRRPAGQFEQGAAHASAADANMHANAWMKAGCYEAWKFKMRLPFVETDIVCCGGLHQVHLCLNHPNWAWVDEIQITLPTVLKSCCKSF